MQPVDRIEVITIGDGQLAVGNQPTAGIQPLGDTVRTRLIVVAGHDAVLAGEIEHAGDQAVVQGLELFITFLLGDRRTVSAALTGPWRSLYIPTRPKYGEWSMGAQPC